MTQCGVFEEMLKKILILFVVLRNSVLEIAYSSPVKTRRQGLSLHLFQVQHGEVSSTTKDPAVELRAHVKAYQKRKYLLVKPGEYFDTTEVGGFCSMFE